MDDVDSLLRVYHSGIQSGELAVGQGKALERLLREHRESVTREKGAKPHPTAGVTLVATSS